MFRIDATRFGSLHISPRPDGKQLEIWTQEAASLGITHVLSLIEAEEVVRYGLQGQGEVLAARGIVFQHFPIDDFDVPDGSAFVTLVDQIDSKLRQDASVLVHCAGGVGRAGTTACCLLVHQGMSATEAIRTVSSARGCTVPETAAQIAFIEKFAQNP